MSLIRGNNIGQTNITATYTNGSTNTDTKTIIVNAVKLTSIDTPQDTIYTGTEQTPQPSVYAVVNGVSTKLEKDVDYTLRYTDNTDAGTAMVIAEGINNFYGVIGASWIINNADITVVAPGQTYIYDGTPQGLDIQVSDVIVQTPEIKYGTTYGVYDSYAVPQITNVSDSKIVYYQVTAPNHNTVEGSYTLTMNPKTVDLEWGTLSWRYDGQSHSTTCSVSNLVEDDVCEVILQNNSITAIGSQTVNATGLTNNNYTLPLTGIEKTLVISPGMFLKVSGVWTPVKEVYKKTSSGWVKLDYAEYNSTFSQKDGKLVRK